MFSLKLKTKLENKIHLESAFNTIGCDMPVWVLLLTIVGSTLLGILLINI